MIVVKRRVWWLALCCFMVGSLCASEHLELSVSSTSSSKEECLRKLIEAFPELFDEPIHIIHDSKKLIPRRFIIDQKIVCQICEKKYTDDNRDIPHVYCLSSNNHCACHESCLKKALSDKQGKIRCKFCGGNFSLS